MHDWSDDSIDWKGIGDAAYYIGANLRRWGRVGVTQTKEKFGTARVYCSFGWDQLHSITHPGHMHGRYPKWLWSIDCLYLSRCMWLVNWAVVPFHKWLYRYFYMRALKKWPHLAGEILLGADWTELLIGLDPRLKREWNGQYHVISWDDGQLQDET
jgi:hypothetical protein